MLFVGSYSIWLANKVLSKPGISGGARILILKRLAASISIFLIANIYPCTYAVYDCFNIPLDNLTAPWW